MGDAETTPGSQAALRRANRERVADALRHAGTLTQAEIARVTGLSAASVSNIVRDLRAAGAVSVSTTSSNGRRARAVTLVRPPGAVIAVDVGPSGLSAALGDGMGRMLAHESIAYEVAADPERGVRRAAWLVETVLARARLDLAAATAVGVSVPGPVDRTTGEIGAFTHMRNWAGFRPAAELGQRLGLPVVAENDANLCAIAEMAHGAGRGLENVVYVLLGEGVSAGVVVGGRVLRGAGGTAGEIGHIALEERGQVCRCGNRGCLETLVGAPYLLDMVPPRGDARGPAILAEALRSAAAGDPGCRRVVAEAGSALGRAVAMLVNTLNPQMVIVGGELAAAGEPLLEALRRSMELGALGSALDDLRVVPGELGSHTALRGALRLAAGRLADGPAGLGERA